jgi:hypothetical protein
MNYLKLVLLEADILRTTKTETQRFSSNNSFKHLLITMSVETSGVIKGMRMLSSQQFSNGSFISHPLHVSVV